MAKHTQGKLEWVEGITSELYAGGKPVMTVHQDEDSGYISFENRADKARLVACWNACEGVNPEAVPQLLAALERVVDNHELFRTLLGYSMRADHPERERAAIDEVIKMDFLKWKAIVNGLKAIIDKAKP